MRGLEVRIPPPAVALVTALLMWLVSRTIPALDFVFPARRVFAIGLTAVGVATAISGVITFRRARTTVTR